MDYSENQVFPTEDFVPLATALQDAQASGRGAVVRTSHVTVENLVWGVPAGINTTVRSANRRRAHRRPRSPYGCSALPECSH